MLLTALRPLALLALSAASLATPAQEADTPAASPAEPVSTHHTLVAGGEELAYEARAGELVLTDESGAEKARIFHVAYLRTDREGQGGDASRPVTFCFNGGPGSSSVWLHLGLFGPRRVVMNDAGEEPTRPPYRLVDNAWSLLDVTDLVFIDPVTTGYSRAAEGEDPGQFHGLEGDVRWVAEFIRLWTTRNGRWDSPKFLAGESYGTTRASALAGELQDRHGMFLNGLMLVSAILNFQTARFDAGNDLPYVLFLPTYAATAFYHGRLDEELSRDLEATLAEVEEFAAGEYATALMQGDSLSEERRAEVARRVARYTGLSPAYVEATNLRIRIGRFCKQLRRAERLTVGRLDSRFTGHDRDAAGEGYEYDPSMSAILGPYTGALNAYVREELGFESDLPYEILTGRVHPWSYASHENRYVNVSETLRQAITKNPHLKVHVASGYYDLATPYFATRYTFDHLGLEPALRGNVTIGHHPAGHMMYVHPPSLEAVARDLRAFVHGALGG
jgi:carboxypeptidase C (cathepsin A)